MLAHRLRPQPGADTPSQAQGAEAAVDPWLEGEAEGALSSFSSDLGAGYSLHGAQVRLVLGGKPCGQLMRLSPTALWATLEGVAPPPLAQPLQVHLESGGTLIGPLRGEVFWRDEAHSPAVGIQLVGVTVEQGRQVLALLEQGVRSGQAEPAASPLPVQEEVTDPERIRSILTAACKLGSPARLRLADRAVRLLLDEVDVAGQRLWWRRDEPGSGWGEPPGDIEVTGYNSAYRLAVPGFVPCGARMMMSLPRKLLRVRYRTERRSPVPLSTRARFHHPLWSELGLLEREVLDVSFSGLGVRSREDDLVFPGLVLQSLEVTTDEGERIRLCAEVRHVAGSGTERTYGLHVSPYNLEDEGPWFRFVSQLLSPTTRTSEGVAEPLWGLLSRSGYGRTQAGEAMRRHFLSLCTLSSRAPQVACQAVWPSERGLEGTLAVLKAYHHTWLSHQLALQPQPASARPSPQEVLRDLYLRTYEHAQGDTDCRWMLSYTACNPWMDRAHVAFALQHSQSGEALARPVQVLAATCEEQGDLSGEVFDVGPATGAEQALLVRQLARTRPTCYREALDLVAGRLDMESVANRWRTFGLERERRLLVARRGGRAVAMAVLELAQRGTNLLQILDCMRLFVLAPEGRLAASALLEAARRWYASRERSSFLYLHEEESWQPPVGLQPVARLNLWILSARLIPEFLEHVSELTAGYQPSR